MSIPLLIAISFSFGFIIESIIGFGGGLIAYAILGFFMNTKEMVLSGLYIGTCASLHILLSDHKSFAKEIIFRAFPICFLGTMIGVLIFSHINTETMLVLLGALSIILSTKIIFFDDVKFPKIFTNSLLLIGGISHGLFGIGGPFIVNALKDEFKHKSELRSTMAAFFVTLNIVRIFQLSLQGEIHGKFFAEIWWVVLPVFVGIYLGHKIHLKISEIFFKKMIGAMTMFAGIMFLFK